MKYALTFSFLLFLLNPAQAMDESQIQKLDWNGIEVVYLKDDRFPTYDVSIYFADGSFLDMERNVIGEVQAAFSLMTAGTVRYNQKDISDNLEYFGASYGNRVFHEQTSYNISGLVKDVVPTVKKICHIFRQATFPQNEIKKEQARRVNTLKNMVNNAPAMAHRAFREITLKDTPFQHPSDGKLKDVYKISPKGLKEVLTYFNDKVKKRIYLSGPEDVLNLKSVFANDCRWKGEATDFERTVSYEPKQFSKPEIHLITVPEANQARVIVGRFMNIDEARDPALNALANEYLGGGFTSQLNEEIRVNRNLTYSIYSVVAGQKYYGRAIIASFTKNQTIREIIEAIRQVVEKVQNKNSSKQSFARAQSSLSGSHPFKFELSGAFLGELMQQDHLGRPYDEIYEFQKMVRSKTYDQVADVVKEVFDWNKMTILILGDKSLLKSLKPLGEVKVHSYKEFL